MGDWGELTDIADLLGELSDSGSEDESKRSSSTKEDNKSTTALAENKTGAKPNKKQVVDLRKI